MLRSNFIQRQDPFPCPTLSDLPKLDLPFCRITTWAELTEERVADEVLDLTVAVQYGGVLCRWDDVGNDGYGWAGPGQEVLRGLLSQADNKR